ncbi:hypothetical protein [Motilimonas pumila]|uniref:Uncharacterized protein n=1 Tax=Motilimonas pumila TaxID=2303987 RepID=A0A418YBT1_9GAMM|nr:hypothetical protein [Motilimonas pumila]RJG41899.1 hypothetical protein D1Z90_15515 [Motilimonas pumila]
MAYDYGSSGLGIKNPYKVEGFIRLIAGVLISLLGLYGLLSVPQLVEQDIITGWIYAGFGFLLLILGLKRAGGGAFQLFRFFVGRSVPSSLAFNFTKSEKDNALAEKKSLAYNSDALEAMLMGRKNSTFIEPQGWLSRLVHSLFPKLIFLPYPVRNITQDIASVLMTTVVAFVAFGLASFVSASGLAGSAGHIITPVFSVLLLVYLVLTWRSVAAEIVLSRVTRIQSKGAASLAKIIAFSILFPVAIGLSYQYFNEFFQQLDKTTQGDLIKEIDRLAVFSAWPSLMLLLALAVVASVIIISLVIARTKHIEATTEVSEYRDNLQESVHPNEIFINIENIVLANRRYKEIPNRTYRDFDPKLKEQSQGKGSFSGELLIETQPEFKPVEFSPLTKKVRLFSTIAGQVLVVVAAYLFYLLASDVSALATFIEKVIETKRHSEQQTLDYIVEASVLLVGFLGAFFSWQIVSTVGRILGNASHVFWSEMQFESLLMYMKTEGTFTESKISTGMAINDSTRSENVVVRSSITPWLVSSRITTSTFATSGNQNLELPRYIMSLKKNDQELETIVQEIKGFLQARETLAGFKNTADLQNAENILQVNQVSRQTHQQDALSQKEQEQAAAIKQNEQQETAELRPTLSPEAENN